MKLIANIPILYLARQYRPGDELPCENEIMLAAWLANKSAHWEKKEEEGQEKNMEEITKRGRKGKNDV